MVGIFPRFPGYKRSTSTLVERSIEKDDDSETTSCGSSSSHDHVMEYDLEFKPMTHPAEPPDNDGPIPCPIPDSTVFRSGGTIFTCLSLNNGGTCEEQSAESFMRRKEKQWASKEGRREELWATEGRRVALAGGRRTTRHGSITPPRSRSPLQLFGSPRSSKISLLLPSGAWHSYGQSDKRYHEIIP